MEDEKFKQRHRTKATAFTRQRCLPFVLVLTLILKKGVKSLQNVVNEATDWLNTKPVTASAYSQARYNLKHTAFIELNQKAIVKVMYSDSQYKTYQGFRLLAIDGSRIILPNSPSVRKEFGVISYTNGKDNEISGDYPCAVASVMFDVLNRIAIDAVLGDARAYEVNLATGHLAFTDNNDLILMDRNYATYRMLAECAQHKTDCVIRCSANSFTAVRSMIKGEGTDSQIVTLTPSDGQLPVIKTLGLPLSLKVRLVRVLLETGEYEVLVTTLLDESLYETGGFKALYYLRWGVETFYGLIKTRLDLENFTGKGSEAVKQDFHATVYLSGLESILTMDAQAELDSKNTQNPQNVNRAVSFNAIKNKALDLLLGDCETEDLLNKLTILFLTNPVCVRKDRNPPRKNSSPRTLLNYQKRNKKHCF